MPIPADETRSVEELLQPPEAEIDAVFGSAGPGRYAIVCFLPVGSDDSVLESEGPPPEGEAPPHAMQGMFAELTVVS